MSRHLDNLTRLLRKMQLRYGDGDTIVIELRTEIEKLRRLEPSPPPRRQWATRDSHARDYTVALLREGAMTGPSGHSQAA